MAGSRKVAVLATLMFALLVSGSLIEAARPVVAEGSNIATDGTVVVRDPHSRQLRLFFGGWPFWGGCWGWFWGGCGRRFVTPIVIKHDDDKRRHSRKLNTFHRGYGWPGWFGWGWGGWGWGWGGFWGRR